MEKRHFWVLFTILSYTTLLVNRTINKQKYNVRIFHKRVVPTIFHHLFGKGATK